MGAEPHEQATAAPASDDVIEAEIVDPGPEVETASEEGDLISAELTAAQAELDEYRDTLQRLKAEFDNYKKRVVREQTTLVERASAELIRELLPVLDALDAAVGTDVEGDEGALKLKQGVEMTWTQLMSVLGNAGLERIAETGVAFDPERHEAVLSEVGEPRPDGGPIVDEVYRSGWILKGRVLRPAMVKVKE
jgi:molecular chaperone GrpE